MSSISQKRDAYKVEIRKKRVQQKIAQLRAALMQSLSSQNEQYSEEQIIKIVNETLSSKQKLIENIQTVKSISYNLNEKNAYLFFPLITDYCYVLSHLQDLKQTENIKDKNIIYNDIVTILINISSNEAYQWPPGEYLPIIKNLLKKEREVDTMWLLSNILYQKNNPVTQEYLTRQLVKYDCITYCSQRLDTKFQSQQDVNVFCCFVSSFMTNSTYLTLQEFKKILKVLQQLSSFNSESIDWFIADSMIDHAPHLAKQNYELLYSQIITNIKQRYIKKKKTKMVLKFLQFVKIYILSEIQQTINSQNQLQFKDNKLAKSNYQRISLIILPILNLCVENLSPEVKANLMEISCILLEFYFSFIDLEHHSIFMTLAEGLNKNAVSVLNKYSNKALYWQLKLFHILLNKVQEYKLSKEIICSFMEDNKIIEAFSLILKEKNSVREISEEIADLMLILLSQVQFKSEQQSFQYHIHELKHNFELILNNHQVQDENLYQKFEQVIQLCENKI